MHVTGNVVSLLFDHAPNGLTCKSPEITEFELAGPERNFVPAHARIINNRVEVWAEDINEPVAVRFAFRDAPTPNLFNREGLPVIPFRTDNWDLGLCFSE
jgi:sialate O-acetylesterase